MRLGVATQTGAGDGVVPAGGEHADTRRDHLQREADMRRIVWILVAIPLLTIPRAAASTWALQDIGVGTGLAITQETWTADAIDYDNDGLMDLWIGYHDHGGKLWRNDGDGTMSYVARSAWPEFGYRADGTHARIDRHDSAWGD